VNLRVPSSCLLYETHWESATKAIAGCSTTNSSHSLPTASHIYYPHDRKHLLPSVSLQDRALLNALPLVDEATFCVRTNVSLLRDVSHSVNYGSRTDFTRLAHGSTRLAFTVGNSISDVPTTRNAASHESPTRRFVPTHVYGPESRSYVVLDPTRDVGMEYWIRSSCVLLPWQCRWPTPLPRPVRLVLHASGSG